MVPLLEARNLRKVFTGGGVFGKKNPTVALENFSMIIRGNAPSFTTVAGESGSGKTTLARLLLGFVEPTSGNVLYQGKDIWAMTRKERKAFRKDIQAIFQDPFEVYNPFYKVDHILTTPVAKFKLASSKTEAQKRIVQALQTVGLRIDETLGRYPHQLSGGQRQRITIARALLLKPRLIIADEPVSMVDASLRATILEELHTLYRTFGMSFLYITHDLTTAYQVSENIVILYQGTVAEAGGIERVIKAPQHPYTQELIRSIPVPDPERRWMDALPSGSRQVEDLEPTKVVQGCRYLPRCPHAMPHCAERLPPLFQTGERRAVACYLYEDAPPMVNEDLTTVFGHTPASSEQGANGERRCERSCKPTEQRRTQ